MPLRSGTGADPAARLLLVDRDPTTGRVMADALRACVLGPVTVAATRSGREAAELLRAGPHDIVLIDLSSIDDLAPQTEEAVARLVKLADGALTIALSEGASVTARRCCRHACRRP